MVSTRFAEVEDDPWRQQLDMPPSAKLTPARVQGFGSTGGAFLKSSVCRDGAQARETFSVLVEGVLPRGLLRARFGAAGQPLGG